MIHYDDDEFRITNHLPVDNRGKIGHDKNSCLLLHKLTGILVYSNEFDSYDKNVIEAMTLIKMRLSGINVLTLQTDNLKFIPQ